MPAVGIYLSQTTDRDNLAQVRLAEELGFDAAWLSDVLGGPQRFEAISLASAMLGATSRIRVGVNVVNTTTWYPQTLARAGATLDAVSGGRFVLGLGAGYRPFFAEQTNWGYPLPEGRGRLDYFGEVLAYLHAYFQGSRTTFEGAHIGVLGATASPLLLGRRPLFLVGGTGPTVMRLAARFADMWDGVGGWKRDEKGEFEPFVEEQLRRFAEALGAAGRHRADVRVCATIYLAVERTRERAEGLLEGAAIAVDNRPPVVGTTADAVAFLAKVARMGVDEFQLFPVGVRLARLSAGEMDWQIRAAGEEILPALRGLT